MSEHKEDKKLVFIDIDFPNVASSEAKDCYLRWWFVHPTGQKEILFITQPSSTDPDVEQVWIDESKIAKGKTAVIGARSIAAKLSPYLSSIYHFDTLIRFCGAVCASLHGSQIWNKLWTKFALFKQDYISIQSEKKDQSKLLNQLYHKLVQVYRPSWGQGKRKNNQYWRLLECLFWKLIDSLETTMGETFLEKIKPTNPTG